MQDYNFGTAYLAIHGFESPKMYKHCLPDYLDSGTSPAWLTIFSHVYCGATVKGLNDLEGLLYN